MNLDKCPVCKSPVEKEFSPFCSRYCQNRDLLNWMNESYKIPVEDSPVEQDLDYSEDE